MFEQLEMAPADPILGLSAAFKLNSNPDKINLGVGVYQDSSGETPILDSVKTAEERGLANEKSKSYLSIEGSPEYGIAVRKLLLGQEHEILSSERAVTVQSPGGTGALRIAELRIEPALMSGGDRQMLQDLVIAASNAALEPLAISLIRDSMLQGLQGDIGQETGCESLNRQIACSIVSCLPAQMVFAAEELEKLWRHPLQLSMTAADNSPRCDHRQN